MYPQCPQPSSSPPVMMPMPVKQGLPPQPVLPVAHPLPPVSTRMKPPPLEPPAVGVTHHYPHQLPHPHSNGQLDDSYSPVSQHLPLTPQYCEAIPLPPLIVLGHTMQLHHANKNHSPLVAQIRLCSGGPHMGQHNGSLKHMTGPEQFHYWNQIPPQYIVALI
ncbi:hypothetical protein GOODEAATRI_008438 [Goodea atripinnis]|uniref:Amelogenin n=1 Tax=Goodea atripinnis TaxID=208336 RepID=A0ABV0PWN1_9TELE